MSRPRHRRKSSLLWKMLCVAGVINLVLWPALIHEGIFTGIRQEVLIPVSLITVPASHKLPDALRVVTRPRQAVTASASVIKPRPPVPPKPSVSPHSSPQVALAKPKAAPQSPRLALVPHAAIPALLTVPHKEAHPSLTTSIKPAPTTAYPGPVRTATHHLNPVLAARIARAKRLEAEGHQVAVLIAQQRASREAALPPSALPTVPAAISSTPPPQAAKQVLVVRKSQPPVQSRNSPAVAVWEAHPMVPDAMMTQTWHATFRGAFLVRRDGSAKAYMVSSTGFRALDRRALAAARRWKFRPARRNGVAVAGTLPFAFAFDVHPSH